MRKRRIVVLLLSALFCIGVMAYTKHALVVGIGIYQDKRWNAINGDHDLVLLSEMLRGSGFHDSDVKMLQNEEATKKNIIKAFEELISESFQGDVVYVHFSGHGQQMTDLNGDEEDGWDECWIPYDAQKEVSADYHGENHLVDDEINGLLVRLKKKIGKEGKMLVIVDACHSGSSSRSLEEVYRGTSTKFVLTTNENASPKKLVQNDWIAISACKDYQLNSEVSTSQGQFGKLTYALSVLSQHAQSMSNSQFYDALKRVFEENRGSLPQTPVLDGQIKKFKISDIFCNF